MAHLLCFAALCCTVPLMHSFQGASSFCFCGQFCAHLQPNFDLRWLPLICGGLRTTKPPPESTLQQDGCALEANRASPSARVLVKGRIDEHLEAHSGNAVQLDEESVEPIKDLSHLPFVHGKAQRDNPGTYPVWQTELRQKCLTLAPRLVQRRPEHKCL
eukprot:4317105-Amphidinium_carterae.2